MVTDLHELPLTAPSTAAADAFNQTLRRYLSYRADTAQPLFESLVAQPDFAMGQCLKGYLTLLGFKQANRPAAAAIARDASRLAGAATPREQMHAAALQAWRAAAASTRQVDVQQAGPLMQAAARRRALRLLSVAFQVRSWAAPAQRAQRAHVSAQGLTWVGGQIFSAPRRRPPLWVLSPGGAGLAVLGGRQGRQPASAPPAGQPLPRSKQHTEGVGGLGAVRPRQTPRTGAAGGGGTIAPWPGAGPPGTAQLLLRWPANIAGVPACVAGSRPAAVAAAPAAPVAA